MLDKDRAEHRLGFVRSPEPELQPRDPQPYLDVGGIPRGDSLEDGNRFDGLS